MAPQVLSKETEKKNRPIQEKGGQWEAEACKNKPRKRGEMCEEIEERKREEVCWEAIIKGKKGPGMMVL